MSVDALNWMEFECDYVPSSRKSAAWAAFIALHHYIRHDEPTATVEGKTLERIAHFVRMNRGSIRKGINVLEEDGEVKIIGYPVGAGGVQPPNDYIMIGYGKSRGYEVDEEAVIRGLEERNKARTRAEAMNGPDAPTARPLSETKEQTGRAHGASPGRAHGASYIGTGKVNPSTNVEGNVNVEKPLEIEIPPITVQPIVKGKDSSHSAAAESEKPEKKPKRKSKSKLTKEEQAKRDAVFFSWVEHLEERWGYKLPSGRWGEERRAAWNIAKQGYTPEEVIDCYDDKKKEWDQTDHMRLNAITSHIAAWKASQRAGHRVGRLENGRRESAAEMDRKIVKTDTSGIEAEIMSLVN